MKYPLAPIVLFVYNRYDHTMKTINALKKNKLATQSDLYIFSDAPAKEAEAENVRQVRCLINSLCGFKSVTVVEQSKNMGLADSIISGVTDIVNKFGRVIVLEDDLVTAPNFLNYMNDALEKYSDEDNVYSISGYSYCSSIDDNTYFLKLTTSWGWATWKEKWHKFKRDHKELQKYLEDKGNKCKFDYDNTYKFSNFSKLSTSWAVYWYFQVHKQDGLTLYPQKSLVQNIGFDGSGVHSTGENDKALSAFEYELTDDILEKKKNKKEVQRKFNSKNYIKKIKDMIPIRIKDMIRRFLINLKLYFIKRKITKDCYIDKSVHVLGWKSIKIGTGTAISEGCWLNVNNRSNSKIQINIGSYSYIGKRSFFSSGHKIIIKDYFMGGINCQFLGSNHIVDNPYEPYISTGTTQEGTIVVGLNTWFGANVTVIGNVSIGNGSIIGACSLVTKDIPPFSVAVGTPAQVIKRFNFKEMKWISVDEYDSSMDVYIPTDKEYLRVLMNTKVSVPLNAASKRIGDLL